MSAASTDSGYPASLSQSAHFFSRVQFKGQIKDILTAASCVPWANYFAAFGITFDCQGERLKTIALKSNAISISHHILKFHKLMKLSFKNFFL